MGFERASLQQRSKGECHMFDNQNVVIIVVVLVIALIIGLVLVGFVLNNSDSSEDQVDTSAQLHLVPADAPALAHAPQLQFSTG